MRRCGQTYLTRNISLAPLPLAAFAVGLFTAGSRTICAHSLEGMDTQVVIEENRVAVRARLTAEDALAASPGVDLDGDGSLTEFEFGLAEAEMAAALAARFSLKADGEKLEPVQASIRIATRTSRGLPGQGLSMIPHELELALVYEPRPGGRRWDKLLLDPNFFKSSAESPRGSYKNLVTIADQGNQIVLACTGKETYEAEIQHSRTETQASTPAPSYTNAHSRVEQTTGGAPAPPAPKGSSIFRLMRFFLWEGILHILLGWDHITFVIGLVLLADRLSKLVQVITAFTIAHSVTLILTALDVITLRRPEIVESIIALSIAYVGLENLWRMDRGARWRWAVAFGFGLVHGMGFASALKQNLGGDMPSSTGLVAACLLVFNLGVEVGQLCIIALLFPALQVLRRRSPGLARPALITASSAVLLLGLFWFVDRAVLPGFHLW